MGSRRSQRRNERLDDLVLHDANVGGRSRIIVHEEREGVWGSRTSSKIAGERAGARQGAGLGVHIPGGDCPAEAVTQGAVDSGDGQGVLEIVEIRTLAHLAQKLD